MSGHQLPTNPDPNAKPSFNLWKSLEKVPILGQIIDYYAASLYLSGGLILIPTFIVIYFLYKNTSSQTI